MMFRPLTTYATLLTICCSVQSIYAAPIQAVIGLNSSQVIDTTKAGKLTLEANRNTLLPLQENFSSMPLPKETPFNYWLQEVERLVRVDSRLQTLSYTGVLKKVSPQSGNFLLMVKNRIVELPINDFYLVPLDKSIPAPQQDKYPQSISYQTNQLSWTPQLSLIIKGKELSFFQRALIHNNADKPIDLDNSLLHYSNTARPTERAAMGKAVMLNDSQPASVQFNENEVTYPLAQALTLPAYSDTLYPLQTGHSQVDKKQHSAQVFTHANSRGDIELKFNSELSFTVNQDSMPGVYQVFWQTEDGLLIPANAIALEKLRKGTTTSINTNTSQDISGQLKLISSTSTSLPNRQVWEASLENHSNQRQAYKIIQSSNALLSIENGVAGIQQNTANSVELTGTLNANEKRVWRYTLQQQK